MTEAKQFFTYRCTVYAVVVVWAVWVASLYMSIVVSLLVLELFLTPLSTAQVLVEESKTMLELVLVVALTAVEASCVVDNFGR
jgi:hypothetical protein